jgi:hypothetical protein
MTQLTQQMVGGHIPVTPERKFNETARVIVYAVLVLNVALVAVYKRRSGAIAA